MKARKPYNKTSQIKSAIGKAIRTTFCLSMAIFVVTACSKDEDEPQPPTDNTTSRVVLAYMAAENNLAADAKADFSEMIEGCAEMTDNDTLLVFIDDCSKEGMPCIYEITKKDSKSKISELQPVYTFDEDINSASPDALDKTLDILFSRYKADSYGLVFWSHGSGWAPSNYKGDISSEARPVPESLRRPALTSFGVDTGNNSYKGTGHQMNITDMANVLKKYPATEFIMFDACFMQSVEVAYELRNCTKHIIASPAEIPAWGAPYQKLIKHLTADMFNPNEVITTYHSHYKEFYARYGILLSVVDCGYLEQFANIQNEMWQKYGKNIENTDLASLLNYFLFDEWNRYCDIPDCYDIKGVMKSVITDNDDYTAWEEGLNLLLPYSCSNPTWFSGYSNALHSVYQEQYSGLTMYVEQDKYTDHHFYNAYKSMSWAKAMGYGAEQD